MSLPALVGECPPDGIVIFKSWLVREASPLDHDLVHPLFAFHLLLMLDLLNNAIDEDSKVGDHEYGEEQASHIAARYACSSLQRLYSRLSDAPR